MDRIDRTYRNTLGFPVPLTVGMVSGALVSLVEHPARIAGLQHTRGHFCAEHVTLSEPELAAAVLVPPWPESAPRPEPAPPGAPPGTTPPGDDGGFKPGAEPGEPPPSPEPPRAATEERATPHCRSRGELRQQMAARLVDTDDPVIHSARFTIYASYADHALASQPAAYRRRPERYRKPRRAARDHRAGPDGQGRPGAALRAAPRRAGCGLRGTGPHRKVPAASEAPEAEPS